MLKKVKKCGIVLGMILILTGSLGILAGAKGPKPTGISALGVLKRTMIVGHDMDLKVKMSPKNADEDQLRWKIVSGSQYVMFEDRDLYDDDVEILAKKAGKAKVQCYINGNKKQKVTFQITVKDAAFEPVNEKKKTVNVGDEVELEVVSNARNRDLKWSIPAKYKKIVAFDDHDVYGDDIEVIGLQAGTAKVHCTNTVTKQKVTFTVVVKKNPSGATITRKGSQTRKVGLGDDIDLEVKKSAFVKYTDLKWSIADPNILTFEDGVNVGDEVEVKGRGIGKTTVTCTNQNTKEKVTFEVQVLYYYDDDYDD